MCFIDLPRNEVRDRIPLLRRRRQAYAAVRGDAMAVQDDLHGRILLVEEDGAVIVVVQHHTDARRIEVALVRDRHREAGTGSGEAL